MEIGNIILINEEEFTIFAQKENYLYLISLKKPVKIEIAKILENKESDAKLEMIKDIEQKEALLKYFCEENF